MADTKKKVLVAYATWAGSTADVAERVAEVLNQNGLAAEAVPAKKARDVATYDAFVLGTAVRAGRLMPDSVKFLNKYRSAVESKPFATFVVCLSMKECSEKNRAQAAAYLEPIRERVKPVSEGLFAGVYDPDKVGFVLRAIMKNMIKAPAGDFRRWDEVEAWAKSLAPLLSATK